MSAENTNEPTPVEKVMAVAVNVYALGMAAELLGMPAWAGRFTAALAMAASADDSLPESWQRVGRMLSAPGVISVQALRERGPQVIEKINITVDDVIDVDPITDG